MSSSNRRKQICRRIRLTPTNAERWNRHSDLISSQETTASRIPRRCGFERDREARDYGRMGYEQKALEENDEGVVESERGETYRGEDG